jgi:hypothetical protein
MVYFYVLILYGFSYHLAIYLVGSTAFIWGCHISHIVNKKRRVPK